MGNPVTVNGVTLTLKDFRKFDTNIDAANKPTGPLINMSGAEGGNDTPYTVTVLAYLPDNPLNPLENTSGLQLQGNQIYLNYYGINPVKVLNKQGGSDTLQGREFRVEFNCEEEASLFDLYYIQFTYQVISGASADVIWVRDQNDDPETDRGTVTTPMEDED
ncbi:hypothetical protein [uncultured Tenacibaculum sp.]|uniref:hypothetical protein n=1 Tax=uncultured Tenacibaculum sp. TaxID=174713 RepID=UPI0026337376|nr:hypothetical protein [uncultured Tenacibaculum sp.]